MTSVNQKMASGAAWMILARLSDKTLGLCSTLILARLLVPADFGLIAMAMSVVAFSELLTSFSFDTALVSTYKPPVSHYHTAWTLNVLFMSASAGLIVILAYPASLFYNEPRLVQIMIILGATLAFQGLENIGIVAFRKEMTFGRDFSFMLGKRVAGLCVTIPLAFATQSYWALIAGIVTTRISGVVLSYIMHPFRPHLSLADWRVLLNFSRWLLLNNLLNFLNSRSTDFIIGRLGGSASLGTYNVAYEISTLPTTEIVAPLTRAILPGYAILADELSELRKGYLGVLSAITFLAIPAALGLAAVAEPVVYVLLGEKWLAAIPVIEIIAFYGVWTAIDSNSYAVYLTLGKPGIATALGVMRTVILLPCIFFLVKWYGMEGAAYALLIVASIATPVGFGVLFWLLKIRFHQFVAAIWRPLVSAFAMFAIIRLLGRISLTADGWPDMFATLMTNVAMGAVSYALFVTVLWWLSGRPEGIERVVFGHIHVAMKYFFRFAKVKEN